MKALFKFSIFVIFILIIAYFTNPELEAHTTKLETKFVEQNPITGFLGGGKILSGLVEYHDMTFYSYTTERIKNNKLSFGAFGMVWVVDLDLNNLTKN
jgi:hypothetical protein